VLFEESLIVCVFEQMINNRRSIATGEREFGLGLAE
jgi:hypothetical protein